MLRNSISLIFLFFIWHSTSYGSELTSKEARSIAENYFKSISKINTSSRLTSEVWDTFYKKSFLIRVRYLMMRDTPANLIVVSSDKKAKNIDLKKDLQFFLDDLSSLLVNEPIEVKTPEEAKSLLVKLINIYGIYDSTIECRITSKNKYKCKISNTSPRKFIGEVALDLSLLK